MIDRRVCRSYCRDDEAITGHSVFVCDRAVATTLCLHGRPLDPKLFNTGRCLAVESQRVRWDRDNAGSGRNVDRAYRQHAH